VRTFTVDVAALDEEAFSLGDVIDICDAVDCAPEDLRPLLADDSAGTRRLKAMAAVAWVITRNDEPGLTLADVLAGRVTITGKAAEVDPTSAGEQTTPAGSEPG